MQTTPAKSSMMTSIVVPILIVLAIGAGVGLAGYGIKQALAPPVSATTTPNTNSTTAPQTAVVSMPNGVGGAQGLNFNPANVTIAKGGKVTWNNNDTLPHTVTSTTIPSGAQKFDSGNMNAGATYSVTFTMDGTYHYVCSYHPWMNGIVIVNG
jgi:plastocyanin